MARATARCGRSYGSNDWTLLYVVALHRYSTFHATVYDELILVQINQNSVLCYYEIFLITRFYRLKAGNCIYIIGLLFYVMLKEFSLLLACYLFSIFNFLKFQILNLKNLIY